MRVIDPSVELITEFDNTNRIEVCGRVSYKSEDKMRKGSAEKFVNMLISRGHESPLEHSNICLQIYDPVVFSCLVDIVVGSMRDGTPIPVRLERTNGEMYASGNVRAWRNLVRRIKPNMAYVADFANTLFYTPEISKFIIDLKDNFQTKDKPTVRSELLETRYLSFLRGKNHNIMTMRFICSRATSHELVRHRVMSFTQESQRYVDVSNYTVIRPTWAAPESQMGDAMAEWIYANEFIQKEYQNLLSLGAQKQQARDVLTNACKTEVVATGTIPMWENFFELRCSKAAYPEIRFLAEQARDIYADVKAKTNDWSVPYVG